MAPRKQGEKKDFTGIKSLRISSCFETNANKKAFLRAHFETVKTVKNKMSEHIYANRYLLISTEGAYQLCTQHYKQFKCDELSAWERQHLFDDIVDKYKNSLKQRKKNAKFVLQKPKADIKRYKEDTVGLDGQILHKKGDLKSYTIKPRTTPLTKLAAKLMMIDKKAFDAFCIPLKERGAKESAEAFQKRVLRIQAENRYINSVKNNSALWARLKTLVERKQNNLIHALTLQEYRTGSYLKAVYEASKSKAASKSSHVFFDATNRQRKWFYKFKVAKKCVLYFPLSVNEKYHKFNNVDFDAAHYVKLNDKGNLNVGLQDNTGQTFKAQLSSDGVVGIDLNVKDNFMVVAYHNRTQVYDYDRAFLKKQIERLIHIDKKGYGNLDEHDERFLFATRKHTETHIRAHLSRILNDLEANGVTESSWKI